MVYSYIVEKAIRQSFDDVNHHRWDDAVKGLSPDAYHRVSGDHALGGECRGKQAVKQWFERMGRVFPTLHIEVDQVEVTGWPWSTTVFVKWRANAKLLDGRNSYVNNGIHVFNLRWGKSIRLRSISTRRLRIERLPSRLAQVLTKLRRNRSGARHPLSQERRVQSREL